MLLSSSLLSSRGLRLCIGLALFSCITLLLHRGTSSSGSRYTTAESLAQSEFNAIQPIADYRFSIFSPLSQQKINLLKHYQAHNFPDREGRTFATLLCTRDPSPDDIYLLAARVMLYHFLYRKQSKTQDKPFTVFVAPFVDQWKRDLLMAEGANVIEIPLIEIAPTKTSWSSDRWRDQYTKLNMWNQTSFSKIAYFDGDAFPFHPVDELFDLAAPQRCNEDLLDEFDRPYAREICNYVFAGVPLVAKPEEGVNGGLLIFKPETRMHQRLIRLAPQIDKYDNLLMEQSLLEWAFAPIGPFPARQLERRWNGVFPQAHEEHALNVVHQKIWNKDYEKEGLHWMTRVWDESWMELNQFYQSKEFEQLRKKNGLRPA